MWARNVEVMLALWLAISPFVFDIPAHRTGVWVADMLVALLIMVCSLSSYWRPLRHAYLGTLALALILATYGFVQPRPLPGWQQNHILVGLLLSMFAIVPCRAGAPPAPWQRHRDGNP